MANVLGRRAGTQSVRLINKYPNRRLYDTVISRYITLEEIRDLVIENIPFRVEDKRSKEDITRSILLQVIMEQEEKGTPILSKDVLLHIIRFYGDTMQNSVSHYLELSLQLFSDQQSQFKDQVKRLVGSAGNPLQALNDLADENLPIWRKVRKEFIANLSRRKDSNENSSNS